MGNGLAVLARELSGFGLTWLVQSSVLLALGLVAGRYLRRSGPAVQSGVYRTTLAAVLVCPFASARLGAAGFDGLSLRLPSPGKETSPDVVTPARRAKPIDSGRRQRTVQILCRAKLRSPRFRFPRSPNNVHTGRACTAQPAVPGAVALRALRRRSRPSAWQSGCWGRRSWRCDCGWVRPGCAGCGLRRCRPSRGRRRSVVTSRGR